MTKQSINVRCTRAKSRDSSVRLTWSELRILRRHVCAYLRERKVPNVFEVGIGRKNPHRKRSGELSLIFVVTKRVSESTLKREHRLGKQRRYEVRIGRGKRERWLNLGGDVITAKMFKALPTAAQVTMGVEEGTSGIVLRWEEAGQLRWGVLTVGHLTLDGGQAPPDLESASGRDVDDVAVRFGPTASTARFDAAILSIELADVQTLNNSLDPETSAGLVPDDGVNFNEMNGHCRTQSSDVAIELKAAFAAGFTVTGWPNLTSLLGFRAISNAVDKPFAPGNSGSAVVDESGVPLGMLIAADPSNFKTGFSQPLSQVLPFLASQMGVDNLEIIGFC